VAVQAQKSVWQRGLEARILLQRALAGANRLPQDAMQAVAAGASAELATAFAGLAADAAALLGDLLQLMGALGEQNPAVGEAAAAAAAAEGGGAKAGGKRWRSGAQQQQQEEEGQCGELWEQLDAAYASFVPFRDASIDRWHRKTLLTTGAAPLPLQHLPAWCF
jgi:protein AATF/BFR2